jgi:hypothetical protein
VREVREMMDMNGMVDRCMDAIGSMMGGGMFGSGLLLIILIALLVLWLVGLAAVGVLGFWAVRRFSRPHT